MNVKLKHANRKCVVVSAIGAGRCFLYNNQIHMRVNSTQISKNSSGIYVVKLSSGELQEFSSNIKVTPLLQVGFHEFVEESSE